MKYYILNNQTNKQNKMAYYGAYGLGSAYGLGLGAYNGLGLGYGYGLGLGCGSRYLW